MKWKLHGLASVLALLVIDAAPPPADACGIKLTVATSRPRKGAARTSHPGRVLLVGSPQKRLERDLSAAGHQVEVAKNAGDAKRESYSVIVVGSEREAGEARTRFGDAVIVIRTSDVAADIKSVESHVGRSPVRVDRGRTVVAAGPVARPPVAAAQAQNQRTVVASKPTETAAADEVQPALPPPPTPEPPQRVAPAKPAATTAPPPPPTPKAQPEPDTEKVAAPTKTKVQPEPKRETITSSAAQPAETPAPPAITSGNLDTELYFTRGSYALSKKAILDRAVKWLNANPDVKVALVGCADPTGSSDANMVLSRNRAESVRDYLVQHGIDASRVDVDAVGDTQLKYGRSDGRNRRVSIEAKKD